MKSLLFIVAVGSCFGLRRRPLRSRCRGRGRDAALSAYQSIRKQTNPGGVPLEPDTPTKSPERTSRMRPTIRF